MSEPDSTDPGASSSAADGGVAESVRAAVERTMRATAGSAATTRERAGELVDDVVRRGRDARDELARRSQEAGAELARRGQEATGEVGRRLEVLERRLADLESRLGAEDGVEAEGPGGTAPDTNPEVES
jgi:polyhydroxyalkanoate synthesis regulator phasin